MIELQWHAAKTAPGVTRLVMDGLTPARVPDRVIEELRGKERNGVIELPKPLGLRRGDHVKVTEGAFRGKLAIYQGMSGSSRVAVLLAMLGTERRVILPREGVEPAPVQTSAAARADAVGAADEPSPRTRPAGPRNGVLT